MPLPSIFEIRDLIKNKKQDMTQKEFANQVGVEVTWLNKFINKRIENPEYKNMKRIYDYVESINENILDSTFTSAGKIAEWELFTIKLGTKISEVSKKLTDKAFNQAPVTNVHPRTHVKKIVGVITTKKINELNQNENFDKNTLLAIEHIDTYLPKVPYDFPARKLGCYLKDSQCILVTDDGKIKPRRKYWGTKSDDLAYGIITDEDMLKLIIE